jgi:two-component system, chemotaxis family, chemotaxis protein CheY
MAQLRALVIEDSQQMRRSIMYALQRTGLFEVEEAQDGAEGLRKLSQSRFDIVLTDINMPVLDGLKVVSHIRATVRAAVPIVVITTESAEEDRRRAMSLGASAYLVKPVQAHDVVETVRSLLRLDA